jgi:thiamine transporter
MSKIRDFFLSESEGYYGFTSSGKVVMIIFAILVVILAVFLAILHAKKEKAEALKDEASNEDGKKASVSKKELKKASKKEASKALAPRIATKKLVICAICLALAYVTSNIKFFEMPYGGSITLFSMFFITYIGYCFGVKTGVLCGLAYGILQLIQDPWLLSFSQVCYDYLIAFAALGLSGLFRNLKKKNPSTGEKTLSKKGLIVGYVVAAVVRGISHSIGGYLFWMDYMPDNFPKSLTAVYPIVYNFSFIGAEAVLTVILLMIPGVSAVLIKLRREAND